jgi:hypothetical protein
MPGAGTAALLVRAQFAARREGAHHAGLAPAVLQQVFEDAGGAFAGASAGWLLRGVRAGAILRGVFGMA